jgi:hypothetical protein
MPIHKLAEGPCTLTVAEVQIAPNNFDPTKQQYLFIGTNDERVYVSELSGAKGLARLNLTLESVIGQTLTIEQVKKDGKTFTNLNMGGASRPAAAPAAAPKAAVPVDVPSLGAVYSQCVDQAMATIGAKLEQAGVPFDGAVIQAAAATIFIKATR